MPAPAPTLCMPWGQHRGHQASTLTGGLPVPPKLPSSSGLRRLGRAVLRRQLRMGRRWSMGWGQWGRAVGKAMTGLLCALALP